MVIIAIVLLVLVSIVAFLNTEMILVNFYFTTFSVPLWLILIGTMLIGMLIAALFASAKGARNRQIIKNKNEKIEQVESEKSEAIERAKKETDTQLELQKKEAKIQALQTELSSTETNDIPTKTEPPIQERTVSPSSTKEKQVIKDQKIKTYTPDLPEEPPHKKDQK